MKTVLLLITLLSSLLTHAAVYRGDDAGRPLILDSDSLTHHYEDERLPSPLTPDDDCPAETRHVTPQPQTAYDKSCNAACRKERHAEKKIVEK